jgi:iron complex outermembrane receptor protein
MAWPLLCRFPTTGATGATMLRGTHLVSHKINSFIMRALAGASALAFAQGAASPALADTAPLAATTVATASDGPDSAPDAATDDGSHDIVVTAQHRKERLQDVPTAVSVLDKDLFTTGGVGRSANEILNYVPNASAGTTQHSRPRWWIRGVGAGQQQIDLASPVGFYLDDVYISNANATGIPLFDIDQVEVLRGPQGTLWGKNTTGGAINIISAKPKLSGDQGNYVKLSYGSYDEKIAEGAVGTVIVPDRLAVRASFHVDDIDGRYRNLFTGQKANAMSDDVFRLQVLGHPTDNLESLLSFHYRRYDTQGSYWTTLSYAPNGVYRNGYVPSTGINDVSTNSPEWSNTRQLGGGLHNDWHLGNYTLTAITGYERFDTYGPSDADYTPLNITSNYVKAYSSQWTQELRLASPQSGRLTWLAGLFYFNEKIHSDAAAATLPQGSVPALNTVAVAAPAYSLIDYEHKAQSGAVFGSATFAFTDALKLTAGGRWSRETKTLNFNRLASATASFSNTSDWWDNYTGTYGGAGTFGSLLRRTWDAFTWDITPSWHIDRNNMLYVKVAYGVKSGGFNTAATLPVALIAVAPEQLYSYEVGYKSQWFDNRLSFNATAFHYTYNNVQVNVVGPISNAVGSATISYLQNAAFAHANGAEFELTANPVPNLKLNSSLGLLYTRFDAFQVLNGGANLSGNQFVRSPHLTVNAGATYTIALARAGHVDLEADARYASLQYYYVTPQDAVNRPGLAQRPYTVANARITYTTPGEAISASFYVNNFLNTRYLNHALPANTGTTVTGDVVQWADPRTYGASVVYRF